MSSQRKQCMHLEGRCLGLPIGPRKYFKAQVNHRSVQGVAYLGQFQCLGLALADPTNSSRQDLRHSSECTPVPVFIGVCNIGARGTRTKTGVIRALTLKTCGQITQAFAMRQMCKDQCQKMIISRESVRGTTHGKSCGTTRKFS